MDIYITILHECILTEQSDCVRCDLFQTLYSEIYNYIC